MSNVQKSESQGDFSGVWTALATPFRSDGAVSLDALDRLLDRQFSAGVDGVVPLGTTGESPTLSSAERRDIVGHVVSRARKEGKRVVVGCGSNSTQEALELIEEAAELGGEAALIITPYYNKPTQEGLLRHYLFLAERSPLPILLYHSLGRTGVSLSAATFQSLFEHPRIVGVKEASGDHKSWLHLGKAFGRSSKCLLAGDDDMVATFCAMGARGVISASCNVIPRPFVELWAAVREGNLQRAFQIQLDILPMVGALFCETNPMPVKYALSALGVCDNVLRLPLVPVKAVSRDAIDSAMHAMKEAGWL